MIDVPLDERGAPDLQLFIRACGTRHAHSYKYNPRLHGGYQHITPDDWAAWDAAVRRWQIERRVAYGRAAP